MVSVAITEAFRYLVPSQEAYELAELQQVVARKARFRPFLNDVAVPPGSAVVLPVNGTAQELEFTVQNTGEIPATALFACLTYPEALKSLQHEGWQVQPPLGVFHGDHIQIKEHVSHIAVQLHNIVDVATGLNLPKLVVSEVTPAPMVVPVTLMVSSPQAEKLICRLQLVFVPGEVSIRVVPPTD